MLLCVLVEVQLKSMTKIQASPKLASAISSNASAQEAPLVSKQTRVDEIQRDFAKGMLHPLKLSATFDGNSFLDESKRMLSVLETALAEGKLQYVDENFTTVVGVVDTTIASFPINSSEGTRLRTRLAAIEDAYLTALEETSSRIKEQENNQRRQTANEAYTSANKSLTELEQTISNAEMIKAAIALPSIDSEIQTLDSHHQYLDPFLISSLKEAFSKLSQQVNHFVQELETSTEKKIRELNQPLTDESLKAAKKLLIAIEKDLTNLALCPQNTRYQEFQILATQSRERITQLQAIDLSKQSNVNIPAQAVSKKPEARVKPTNPEAFVQTILNTFRIHDANSNACLGNFSLRDKKAVTKSLILHTNNAMQESEEFIRAMKSKPGLIDYQYKDAIIDYLERVCNNHRKFAEFLEYGVKIFSNELVDGTKLNALAQEAQEATKHFIDFHYQGDISWMPLYHRHNLLIARLAPRIDVETVAPIKASFLIQQQNSIEKLNQEVSKIALDFMNALSDIHDEMSPSLDQAETELRRGSNVNADNLNRLSNYFRTFSKEGIPKFISELKGIKDFAFIAKGKLLANIFDNKIERDLTLAELANLAALKASGSTELAAILQEKPGKIEELKQTVIRTNAEVQKLSQFYMLRTNPNASVGLANMLSSYITAV